MKTGMSPLNGECISGIPSTCVPRWSAPLVQEPGGVDTDVSLAAFPFERDGINRAELVLVHPAEAKIRLCDASDLIILKAFANRPRDWQDIRGIMIRSSGLLDWQRNLPKTTTLASLKEEPEILDRLNQLRQEIA